MTERKIFVYVHSNICRCRNIPVGLAHSNIGAFLLRCLNGHSGLAGDSDFRPHSSSFRMRPLLLSSHHILHSIGSNGWEQGLRSSRRGGGTPSYGACYGTYVPTRRLFLWSCSSRWNPFQLQSGRYNYTIIILNLNESIDETIHISIYNSLKEF